MHIRILQILLVLLLPTSVAALENSSFESSNGMKPWEPLPNVRLTEGQVQVVQDVSHRGKQSLMLSAPGGGEVVVGQVAMLPKTSLWQVRGWIRTQGLEESETAYPSASLQIRTMDGRIVAESPGVGGPSPWREVETTFCVPGDGRFILALVLDNSGATHAQAWFDDLRFDVPSSTRFEQKVLNFPILWNQGPPYTKLLPKNAKGEPGPWICGQVAAAMIARYWSMQTTLRCGGTYWYETRYTTERSSRPATWYGPTITSCLQHRAALPMCSTSRATQASEAWRWRVAC